MTGDPADSLAGDPERQQRLWAPWRLGYVKGTERERQPPEPASWLAGADRACFICRAAGEPGDEGFDREMLVVSRGAACVTLLNRIRTAIAICWFARDATWANSPNCPTPSTSKRCRRSPASPRCCVSGSALRVSTWASTWGRWPGPACRGTFTGTSSRGGREITTSCLHGRRAGHPPVARSRVGAATRSDRRADTVGQPGNVRRAGSVSARSGRAV